MANQQPARSRRGAETAEEHGRLVSIDRLRRACRVYGTDPDDTERLLELEVQARSILASYIGRPIAECICVDYYRTGGRLQLAVSLKAGTDPVVKVQTVGGEQTVTGVLVDRSVCPEIVVADAPAADSRIENPVSVEYTSAKFAGPGTHGLEQAVEALVNTGFYHGGDAMADAAAVQRMMRFLASGARAASDACRP